MHQVENFYKLLKLKERYPELRILPQVDTDCVANDDYDWWIATWGTPIIDEILIMPDRERVYTRSQDYNDLIEEVCDKLDDKPLSDEEIIRMAQKEVDAYPWEKVILVEITP